MRFSVEGRKSADLIFLKKRSGTGLAGLDIQSVRPHIYCIDTATESPTIMKYPILTAKYEANEIQEALQAAYWSTEHREYLIREALQHFKKLQVAMKALKLELEETK